MASHVTATAFVGRELKAARCHNEQSVAIQKEEQGHYAMWYLFRVRGIAQQNQMQLWEGCIPTIIWKLVKCNYRKSKLIE